MPWPIPVGCQVCELIKIEVYIWLYLISLLPAEEPVTRATVEASKRSDIAFVFYKLSQLKWMVEN